MVTSYRDPFCWHLFEAYNAMAAARFADELGALILHADKLTYHRPDGHIQVGTGNTYVRKININKTCAPVIKDVYVHTQCAFIKSKLISPARSCRDCL